MALTCHTTFLLYLSFIDFTKSFGIILQVAFFHCTFFQALGIIISVVIILNLIINNETTRFEVT